MSPKAEATCKDMILPSRMDRVEVIVHKDYYDPILRYLRETRSIELVDVKEILKGYQGAVTPCGVSDRLYRLVGLSSKIGNLISQLRVPEGATSPVQVELYLSEDELKRIESEISSLESRVASLTSEIQALEKLVWYAQFDLGARIRDMMEIEDVGSPEGRHRLEEIMDKVFESLKPAEIEEIRELAEGLKAKAVEESVKKAIVDELATILQTQKKEEVLMEALSKSLNLKLKAELRTKRLRFEVASRVEQAKKRLGELRLKLAETAAENSRKLRVYDEVVNAERVLEEARGLVGKTGATYVIEGWASAREIENLKQDLAKVSNDHCVVRSWRSKHGPTKLSNPKLTGIFERLTVGFGTPSNEDVDPTVLWLVTYPLFFGLMFGDVGHGLLVIAVSVLLFYARRRGLKLDEQAFLGMGGLFNMVLAGSLLLMLGGVAATFFGFLYGTILGSEIWFEELTGLHGPIWFSPFEEPIKLLKVSIIVGIVHVTSGLVLDFANKLRNREYGELIAGPLLWLWFYVVLGYLILRYGFGLVSYALSNIPQMFGLLGIPSILMLIAKIGVSGALEGLGHWMESMLASISHTISYIRILAMKMIHDVFSILFLGVLNALPLFVGMPIFSLLTLVMILILETAFVFLQDLRLHWVEWFLKFYSGTGTSFKPFGIQRQYTTATGATSR